MITQSAVSQQIRTLEEKFKKRLLERVRGRREIRLTPAGEVFHSECKYIIEGYQRMLENMRALSGEVGGKLKVASVHSVGLYTLPDKVRDFMKEVPTAKLELDYARTTRVVRDVLNGTIELGIVAYPEQRRGITIVPMPSDRLVLITAPDHALAKSGKAKVADLDGQDFVMYERDVPTRKTTEKVFKDKGIKVNKTGEFDNIETIKRAVEAGRGVAIVPQQSVDEEVKNKTLAVVELSEKDWTRPIAAIYRSDRTLTAAAQKFLAMLKGKK